MNATLPPLPSTIGTLSDAESVVLNLRYAKAQTNLDNCLTCGGLRTFRWYDITHPGSREVLTYDCPCRDQYRLSRWLWNSGVMIRYQRLSWTDLLRADFAGAQVYADYLAHTAAYVRAGLGLMLYGPRGNGKTLIGNLIIKDLIGRGYDCYVTTFEDMVDAYRAGWDDKAMAVRFDARVRGASVLMVDDLGRERKRGTWTVAEDMLETVVRHRVSCQMPTIFTTNLDPDADLGNVYGGHVISLLSECSIQCQVDGADVRQTMNARDKYEATSGLTRPVLL